MIEQYIGWLLTKGYKLKQVSNEERFMHCIISNGIKYRVWIAQQKEIEIT